MRRLRWVIKEVVEDVGFLKRVAVVVSGGVWRRPVKVLIAMEEAIVDFPVVLLG